MNKLVKQLVLAALVAGLTLTSAQARTPNALADLVGARASSGERALGSRGYEFDHSHGLTAFWWNGRMCVSVVTSNGRYKSIDRVSADHCALNGSGSGGGSGGGGGSDYANLAGKNSIRAIDAMAALGFVNVDSMNMGNTQYAIYYRRSTRECVQMTMANVRVVDIREIYTHPRCR